MSQSLIKKVILGKDVNGKDISDHIEHIIFKEDIDKDNTFEFYAGDESANYLLGLDELDKSRGVVFSFGFIQGEQSLPHIAIIADIEVDYDNAGTRLKVTCIDKGMVLKTIHSNKIWKQTTTDEIIRNIASYHGMDVFIQKTGDFISWDSLPQAGRSNMDFLLYLASRELQGNHLCYIMDNTIYFTTLAKGSASTDLILVGNDQRLLRFSVKVKEISKSKDASEKTGSNDDYKATANPGYQTSGATLGETTIDAWGVITGETQGVSYNRNSGNLTNASTPLDVNNNPISNIDVSAILARVDVPDADRAMVEQNIRTLFASGETEEQIVAAVNSGYKTAKRKTLVATLEEVGNPYRRLNTVITIGGVVTKRYSGNWLVTAVQHIFGVSNYRTVSELTKDGAKKGTVKAPTPNTTPAVESKTEQNVIIPASANPDGTFSIISQPITAKEGSAVPQSTIKTPDNAKIKNTTR